MGSWIQGAIGFEELQSLGSWCMFNASAGVSPLILFLLFSLFLACPFLFYNVSDKNSVSFTFNANCMSSVKFRLPWLRILVFR